MGTLRTPCVRPQYPPVVPRRVQAGGPAGGDGALKRVSSEVENRRRRATRVGVVWRGSVSYHERGDGRTEGP